MKNVRRGLATLALVAGVAACGGKPAHMSMPGPGPQMAAYADDQWVDLPASPLGDWPLYNWVWLADGSGFVQAGAAKYDGDGKIASTSTAAYFSFEQRRSLPLPDIPVTSGVGLAGGAWVGDTLTIVGQDCPPMPAESTGALEFCRSGGMGSKLLLTFRRGDDHWVSHGLPTWLREFDYGTPNVLGVRGGRLLLASGHQPAHIGEFDPASGAWHRVEDAPGGAPGTAPPVIVTTTAVPGAPRPPYIPEAPAATLCLVGKDLVAWVINQPAFTNATPTVVLPSSINHWWKLEGDTWVSLPPPIEGAISDVACDRSGLFASRLFLDESGGRNDLSFVDPVDGTSTLIADKGGSNVGDIGQSTLATGGRVVMTDHGLRLATPTGMKDTGADGYFDAQIGEYLIRTNDPSEDSGTFPARRRSQILHLVAR